MYHTILVPLDGSALGEQALPLACRIAQHTHATVHLVHVHTLTDIVYMEEMPVIDEQLRTLGRTHEHAYLEHIRTQITASNALPVVVANPDMVGTVARTLGDYADSTGCDLVVLATHGRGGLERMWFGSVADALIRTTHLPLLLVRPQQETPHEVTLNLRHILIPLDGSALAETVLESAFALGDVFDADYTLLRVIEPIVLSQPGPVGAPVDVDPNYTQRRQEYARQYLEMAAQRFGRERRRIRTYTVIASSAAPAILQLAEQLPHAAIALATHGRSGLQRFWLGSVADKVVRGATTPVLLFRPPQP